MTTLKYQVLITHGRGYVFASVPDLECDVVAESTADALAAVEQLAGRALRQFEGARVKPPTPSRLSLSRVELSADV